MSDPVEPESLAGVFPDTEHPRSPSDPDWWEDPDLAAAVAEVEEFVGSAGWDGPAQLFALVKTADLVSAEPGLAVELASSGMFTPIAQPPLDSADLSASLSAISWPAEVGGCVLTQEILILPPAPADRNDAAIGPAAAAAHPDRREARLVAGVLRNRRGGACLLRVRDQPGGPPLRGAQLAPGLIGALRATFVD